jgi:hypothetical protein
MGDRSSAGRISPEDRGVPQYGQDKHYQQQLRAACAIKGGKLTLSNLCINMKPILDQLTPRYRLPRRSH